MCFFKLPRKHSFLQLRTRFGKIFCPFEPSRARPGQFAALEIRKAQKNRTTDAFERLSREIGQDLEFDIRFEDFAIEAMQFSDRNHTIIRLVSAVLVAVNAKLSTLMVKNMHVVKYITEN